MSFITNRSRGNFGSMGNISLDDALQIMSQVDSAGNPVPFRIKAVSCDLKRNTGGEIIEYHAVLASPGGAKKSYHDRNDARNIKLVDSGEIRSIHPILTTHINGKTINL